MAVEPIQILADVKSTLAAITAGNGYKTTVVEVTDSIHPWHGRTNRPSVGVYHERTDFTRLFGNEIHGTMRLRIVAHLTGSSEINRVNTIENFADDVIGALHVDHTRGGCAIDTRITGYTTDAQDPDGLDSKGWGVTMVFFFECVYERTTTHEAP